VVLTVGTDCNVGKMTAQIQLTKRLNERGVRTRFVATGQTGIMIEGWGIAVDAVVADSRRRERLVLEGAKDADGAGGRAGVSTTPVTPASPSTPARLLSRRTDPLPPGDARVPRRLSSGRLAQNPAAHRVMFGCMRRSARGASHQVIGISLNTYDITDADARRACEAVSRETDFLPLTRCGSTRTAG
jgi:uncharacterized NAD-dependent epimerase/dehydratase family protein